MAQKCDSLKHILWKAEASRQVAVRTMKPFPIRRLLSGVGYHSGWVKGLRVLLR